MVTCIYRLVEPLPTAVTESKTINIVLINMREVFTTLLDLIILVGKLIFCLLEEIFRQIVPKAEKDIRGEVAVVTGAGHGIGRELSLQLVKLGVRVACWDINKEGGEETATQVRKLGGEAMVIVVDVSDKEAVKIAAQDTRSEMGEVTLLFNNAGIMPCKPFMNHSQQEVEKIFNVNVYSQFWTVHEFLPRMLGLNKGHIISMSSMAGITGTPNLVPYCSSKFAVKGFMDALFLEVRSSKPNANIQMTTIHPFVVDTGLAQKPRSRFQNLIPYTKPGVAAEKIITAMRRNYEYEFIPGWLCFISALTKMIPRRGQLALMDFLDCACDPHDE